MAPNITDVKARPQEILERMGPGLYREAYGRGMGLSAWLETQDPSEGYQDGLDAFGRLLKLANIRTRTMPELGVYADEFGVFDRSPQTRALVPEWMIRQWRRAATGHDVSTRQLYLSSDNAAGSWMFPVAEAADARARQIAPAIPLAELVALTTGINAETYVAYYLTDVPAQERIVRVPEATEVPVAKLIGGDNTVRLRKFGRALEASYETLRRQRIDRVALHLARLAVQTEVDKVAAAIDVLVNGDGNPGTAATNWRLQADLDGNAQPGTLTLTGWLAFKMKFTNPYVCTAVICQEADALQLLLLNTGSANTPLVVIGGASGFGGFQQINPGLADNVRLGWTGDAPANFIVGIDTRFALERVFEIGATIQEIERYVSRQTERLVMTEVEGYCVFDQFATKTLQVNA